MAITLRSSFEIQEKNGEYQFKNPANEWVPCTKEIANSLSDAWNIYHAVSSGTGSWHRLIECATLLNKCGYVDEAGFFERKAESLRKSEPKPY